MLAGEAIEARSRAKQKNEAKGKAEEQSKRAKQKDKAEEPDRRTGQRVLGRLC